MEFLIFNINTIEIIINIYGTIFTNIVKNFNLEIYTLLLSYN